MLLVLYECIFSTCSKCTVAIPRMSQDIFVLNRKSLPNSVSVPLVCRGDPWSFFVWSRLVLHPHRQVGWDAQPRVRWTLPLWLHLCSGSFPVFQEEEEPKTKASKNSEGELRPLDSWKKVQYSACEIPPYRVPRRKSDCGPMIWWWFVVQNQNRIYVPESNHMNTPEISHYDTSGVNFIHLSCFFFLYMISLFCEWISDCIIKTHVLLID